MTSISNNIPQLTGLRAVAAGGIVVYHAGDLLPISQEMAALAHLGVSFFFVLSGFILSHAHARVKAGGTRYSFWFARFARIWPLTMCCLALTLLLIPFSMLTGHKVWPISLPLNIFLLQAWIPMAKSALSFNGVAWTLSVEAFFYLLFPYLRALCLKSVITLFFLILAASLIPIGIASLFPIPLHSEEGLLSISSILTFFPPCRLFEFGIGLISYKAWTQIRCRTPSRHPTALEVLVVLLIGVIVLVISPFFPETALGLWFSAMSPALGFGVLLVVFTNGGGVLSKILSTRPAILLGETSFALYLSHQLLLRALSQTGILSPESLFVSLCIYAATIYLVSWVLWRLVEVPSRRALLHFWKRLNPA